MNARPASTGTGAAAAPEAAFDYSAGLERVMGDQGMYLRVLTRFHHDYRDHAMRLDEALSAGDLVLAQRIAHTLKGAAAMIEAHTLRQLAAQAEQGLRAERVDPLLVQQLEGELARVVAQLASLLQLPAAAAAGPSVANAPGQALGEAELARLCGLLDTGDSAAQDFIEDHDAGLNGLLGAQRMAQLQAAMAAFDFEGALRVLRPGCGD